MLGKRMRQARLVAGLTLEALAAKLNAHGFSITKQALSLYERERRTPGSKILLHLSKVLGVSTSFFLEEPEVDIKWKAYRSFSKLSKSQKESVEAHASSVVEPYVYLSQTLIPESKPEFPETILVSCTEEAEDAAKRLREYWSIGDIPIESMTNLIEDKGGIVINYAKKDDQFDGLSGWVNENIPLICVKTDAPADRHRFNVAHELGHLVMDSPNTPEKDVEKYANRFAGAFLVPDESAYREFGYKRSNISWAELGMFKQKYGISMAATLFRLGDLSILTKSRLQGFWREINWKGWRKKEPFELTGSEKPVRLKQLTLRALSEGIIGEERAAKICPDCLEEFKDEKSETDMEYSPKKLLKLPLEERNKILLRAAEQAREDYSDETVLELDIVE